MRMIRLRFFLQIYCFYLILRKVNLNVLKMRKGIICILAAVMGILPFLTSCEEESKVEHPGLWLSADKTTITADGEDMVTFTVTLDDVDVTSQCTFCNQENCYPGNTFSTTTAGEYVFHATYQGENSDYQGQNSNEVTITAQ